MNLLKVTMFLGTESDAFTVYFQLIESTLLIEALRNDSVMKAESNALICESCHKVGPSQKKGIFKVNISFRN
jgi:hypothetical protein